jgi:hypothetical protein
MLPPLDDVLQDLADLDGIEIVHRHTGVRAVIEGRFHSGDGEVVQLVVRRTAA